MCVRVCLQLLDKLSQLLIKNQLLAVGYISRRYILVSNIIVEGIDKVNGVPLKFGKDEAVDYVDNLLEHHEVDDKKEYKDKKELFLSKV